jgi:O-ureido-D-serine cyclo-ligase
MKRIALVTTRAARALDEDFGPLAAALARAGAAADAVDWDDAGIAWHAYDAALLRATWDYAERLAEFLAWAEYASAATRLFNPLPLVRWNTDKHYLAELAGAGVPCVPGRFVEPGSDAAAALGAFLEGEGGGAGEFVVKPAIGAGSRDARRHARRQRPQALAHIDHLLGERRSVLLQPYLASVDTQGETALVFFDGVFSHAIRKGALLRPGEHSTQALFAAEEISASEPTPAELQLGRQALAALPARLSEGAPLYARVDLIHAADGAPRLLELELTEPSLFFAHGAGAADRCAAALRRRLVKD